MIAAVGGVVPTVIVTGVAVPVAPRLSVTRSRTV